jgi:hypothetical protein
LVLGLKTVKVEHQIDPLLSFVIERSATIEGIVQLVKAHTVCQIRGTPASGKTVLSHQIRNHICQNYSDLKPILTPSWVTDPPSRAEDRLASLAQQAGYSNVDATYFQPHVALATGLIFIIDEAQMTYRDKSLWLIIKDQIYRELGPRFILLSSYGSPSQRPEEVGSIGTPIFIFPKQKLSLVPRNTKHSNVPLGLLLSKDETFEAIDKAEECQLGGLSLANDIKEVIYELTNGHCGGIKSLVSAISRLDVSRFFDISYIC